MIKLIIFDWDDVFTLGSKEGYFACYHKALIGVGVYLEQEEEARRIIRKWGMDHIEELKELLREHPELVKRAAKIYENNLFGTTYVDCLKVVPGSTGFLLSLKKRYILALVTGIHPNVLKERIMPKFGFPQVFSYITSAYDLEAAKTKPHPFSVLEIMKKVGVTKDETIVVGDAANDVQMAFRAGVAPVVVLTGHLNSKEANKLGVKYILDDVTKLEDVLRKINFLP